MIRRRAVAVVVGMLGTVLLSGTASAANAPTIRADLEGRAIKASAISSYYCHDFAFPRVRCFSTAAELEAATAAELGAATAAELEAASSHGAMIAAAFGPNDYVTIYSEPTYGGSYMHVSQNYDTLFWIGWSDRISSYKSRNYGAGTFWSDWYGSGRRTDFCCNLTVPILAPAVDNTFTSVYRA